MLFNTHVFGQHCLLFAPDAAVTLLNIDVSIQQLYMEIHVTHVYTCCKPPTHFRTSVQHAMSPGHTGHGPFMADHSVHYMKGPLARVMPTFWTMLTLAD